MAHLLRRIQNWFEWKNVSYFIYNPRHIQTNQSKGKVVNEYSWVCLLRAVTLAPCCSKKMRNLCLAFGLKLWTFLCFFFWVQNSLVTFLYVTCLHRAAPVSHQAASAAFLKLVTDLALLSPLQQQARVQLRCQVLRLSGSSFEVCNYQTKRGCLSEQTSMRSSPHTVHLFWLW